MNKDKRNNIQLLGTLNNADESGIIANANQIYDANEDKSTQDVSKEHTERIKDLEAKEDAMQTTLENITKTGEASAASNVTYNHSDSKLDATNVQQAIDEISSIGHFAKKGGVVNIVENPIINKRDFTLIDKESGETGVLNINGEVTDDSLTYKTYTLKKTNGIHEDLIIATFSGEQLTNGYCNIAIFDSNNNLLQTHTLNGYYAYRLRSDLTIKISIKEDYNVYRSNTSSPKMTSIDTIIDNDNLYGVNNEILNNGDYKKYPVSNWHPELIERDIISEVWGKPTICTKIVKPSEGNLNEAIVRFISSEDIPNFKLGNIVNINFSVWVPEDCIPVLYLYSKGGTSGPLTIIKGGDIWRAGINNVIVSLKVVDNKEYTCYWTTTLPVGTEYYVSTPYSYIGNPKYNIFPVGDLPFVESKEGYSLVSLEDVDKIKQIQLKTFINDITTSNTFIEGGGSKFSYTKGDDGEINIVKNAGDEVTSEKNYAYVNYGLDSNVYFKYNHKYYIAIDMIVRRDSESEGSSSSGGNFYGYIIPKYADPVRVGTGSVKQGVVHGTRGILKASLDISNKENIESYPTSNHIFFQFGSYLTDSYFDATIYKVFCVDLGETGTEDAVSWEYIDSLVSQYGLNNVSIVESANHAISADNAKVAEKVLSYEVGTEIDLWGDSLTAQNYGKYLQPILDRNCYTHGFGGKRSTYIRDQYLSAVNKERTQIIWIGRNNFTETDIVVDDIRDMVEAFGGQNFLIMLPPNGNYGTLGEDGNGTGEMKSGTSYDKFIELGNRLSKEYPSNYLDIREAVIYGWRMGNIKLLSSFIQPKVGSNVQIEVSDAEFLTTYNSSDLSKFGKDLMSKIRIGINGLYDTYKVISKDDSTHLTVQLVDTKYKQPGNTVDNLTDDGGTSSIKYLRVMQNADYLCYINDTTLSTFRADGIHMTDSGLKYLAEVVARKIISMKI